MNISDLIKTGHQNAVERFHLMAMSGMPDREMRREIERICETETPVLNMLDGSGYFIPSDKEADLVLKWIAYMKKYITSLQKKIKVGELWLARHGGQEIVKEESHAV